MSVDGIWTCKPCLESQVVLLEADEEIICVIIVIALIRLQMKLSDWRT
jgi:hypothetical protein